MSEESILVYMKLVYLAVVSLGSSKIEKGAGCYSFVMSTVFGIHPLENTL